MSIEKIKYISTSLDVLESFLSTQNINSSKHTDGNEEDEIWIEVTKQNIKQLDFGGFLTKLEYEELLNLEESNSLDYIIFF
jgi:hypothetical protein